jgi:hypothetical protein
VIADCAQLLRKKPGRPSTFARLCAKNGVCPPPRTLYKARLTPVRNTSPQHLRETLAGIDTSYVELAWLNLSGKSGIRLSAPFSA